MKPKHIIIFSTLIGIVILALTAFIFGDFNFEVLNPKGVVAEQQRDLLVFTTLLSLIVILPVFFLTFYIAHTYRADNKKAKYTPEWDHSKKLEVVWWGVPLIIIGILAVITWQTTHSLDPYRPLESDTEPLTVQVVALQWKWLFIYPEQDIATVNQLVIPVNTPINFEITADAPMNSFWIPQLGGQVYAMTGMTTKLHLMANETGRFNGSSANISGEGFADMRFTVDATSNEVFDAWVASSRASNTPLDIPTYDELAKPATVEKPLAFSSRDAGLYDTILMKYMSPDHDHSTMSSESPNAQITEDGHADHH